MWSAQYEFDNRSVHGEMWEMVWNEPAHGKVEDYGLALAPTPKILTYGPTKTSRRWHGMQEG